VRPMTRRWHFSKNQKYEQAATLFEEASQLDPADIEALNNYGIALMKSGNLNKAWSVVVKTLSIKPDRTPAWANFGDILALQGKEEMAVASYLNTYRFSKNRENTHKYFSKSVRAGDKLTNSECPNEIDRKAEEMSFSHSPVDSTVMEQ